MENNALRNILLNEPQSNWIALISRYLKSAPQSLVYGHGTSNADDEAFWIMDYLQRRTIKDHDTLIRRLLEILDKRVNQRMPLAYIFEEAYFATLSFKITKDVIVPRSPIAEMVLDDFQPWLTLKDSSRVLELCTGCGCIALAIAHFNPTLKIDATDISSKAINLAKENASRLNLENTVSFHQVDLFPKEKNSYDLIISNPPYVSSRHVKSLPMEYRHEPEIAFDGGDDGLVIVDRIIERSSDYLNEKGFLILEVGESWEQFSRKYSLLEPIWIEFSQGGEGVCIISKEALSNYFLNS
jgi:ribosomal protein L3 glutamine methyltransferase